MEVRLCMWHVLMVFSTHAEYGSLWVRCAPHPCGWVLVGHLVVGHDTLRWHSLGAHG